MIYGIDFGNLKSRVAVTRRGGVDVILNELSQRDSASFVSYGANERFIGEKGFDQAIRNQKNTVSNMKRLLGIRSDCPSLEYEKSFITCPVVPANDNSGEVEYEVDYAGSVQRFRPQQSLAALLGRLHSFVELDSISNGGPPVKGTDCVISCPVYFTITQRKALLQAAEIAGLNCMALMNETTACALDYGIFKSSTFPDFEEKKLGTIVMFADIGHSATTISVASFWKGSMKMLGSVYDTNLGTREIDNILLHHFRKEILAKYKVDVFENPKARFRLLQALEKMKIMLSANPVSNLNVECLMNDVDISFPNIKRDDLEAMIQERFLAPLEKLCISAVEAFEGIITTAQTPIEIIGGGSRIPSVKAIIAKVFGVSPGVTLVATESIAKGCAILAAMLSPKFKVREYAIQDRVMWNVHLGYLTSKTTTTSCVSFLGQDVVNKVVPLFKKGEVYPKSLDLTFERNEPFDLHYFYDTSDSGDASEIMQRLGAGAVHVGHVRIGNVVPPAALSHAQVVGPLKVRVRFRMSFTGLVEVENAFVVQEYEELSTNAAENDAESTEKKTTKKKEARVEATREIMLFTCMPPEAVSVATKSEADMVRCDRLVFETLEAKNSLESYMYDNTAKLSEGGELFAFASSENIALFIQLCREFESWLCDEGENSTKEEYTSRLLKLQNIAEPALRRYHNHEAIPHESQEYHKQINSYNEKVTELIQNGAVDGEWIKKEDMDKVQATLSEATEWIEKEFNTFKSQAKYIESTFTCESIKNKLQSVRASVQPILNRPKPIPKPAATPAEPTQSNANTSDNHKPATTEEVD